jgi:DNA replication regulator DPB11
VIDQKKKPRKELVFARQPFIEEDSDLDNPLPKNGTHISSLQGEEQVEPQPNPPSPPAPLQELSQERVNSPKKPTQQPLEQGRHSPEKQALDSVNSKAKPSGSATSGVHLNNSIAALLAQKQSAVRAPSNPPSDNLSRRKRGLLGRASSGSSLPSVSRSNSLVPPGPSQSQSQLQQGDQVVGLMDPPLPSQKIIYEDESAWEERAKIIKRMGGRVSVEPPVRIVGSIGVVKDVGGDGCVGQRVRRRAR